jgi:hypothetical protein
LGRARARRCLSNAGDRLIEPPRPNRSSRLLGCTRVDDDLNAAARPATRSIVRASSSLS